MLAAQSLQDERLRALSDPVRRDILRQISRQEKSAGEIAAGFDITRPAISRHLRVLRQSHLVTTREDGTTRYYQADQAAISGFRRWFDGFWEAGLPRLKALAEAEHRAARKKGTDRKKSGRKKGKR